MPPATPSTGDPGDVFYIRSTDMGVTFSAPFRLNANTETTKAQWQPNLSASDTGTLLATWYDESPRTSSSCQPSTTTNLCYQMHSSKSTDNGMTWLADETLSDVASPLPLQPDGTVQTTYAGDYDYGSAIATEHVTSWVDGRVPSSSGHPQQDVFTDRELGGTPSPTPTASPSATATATATSYTYTYSHRLLYGELHDGYCHWHGNRGRDRYRQPLRRLLNADQSTFPGQCIWRSDFRGVSRVERRPALCRDRQDVRLRAVCPGRPHSSRRSVLKYPVSVL